MKEPGIAASSLGWWSADEDSLETLEKGKPRLEQRLHQLRTESAQRCGAANLLTAYYHEPQTAAPDALFPPN